MPHAVITGMIRTVLAAAQEFNLNSQASVSKELVRMLKLNFKLIDVVQFVAPDSCQGALPGPTSEAPVRTQLGAHSSPNEPTPDCD